MKIIEVKCINNDEVSLIVVVLSFRICCRMIMGCKSDIDRKNFIDMIKAFNSANVSSHVSTKATGSTLFI